ncbi:hypothetical protein [Pyrobaculum ferrireducens]|uniref:Uncharacterized protein n=1 Tax=Pyrobaculum ferrireducens TaxID=1104324 RepID=G7VFR7_9CREN|nr:hypothetical protein [Pyrobaculum ferrireducens]AET34273.1 hypothetical protein P186_2897 [Pyrobaculum ferrireducens]
MSRGRYVYEDPSIGAIISALSVVDFVLGERHYDSYLKQTVKGPGDLSLVYKNAKVVLIEFKAPELATFSWRYEIGQVKSGLFNAYLELAKKELLFLGLIHGLVDPYNAPPGGMATFRHAPLTTAFVLPNDAERCLTMLSRMNTTTLHVIHVHGNCLWNCFPFPNLKRKTYRRDFVRCYSAICKLSRYCNSYCVSELHTGECRFMHVVDLATLLCCLEECKFGIRGEEAMPLLKKVIPDLQKALHEITHLYVLTSTLELIPLRDFLNLLEGGTPPET